MILLTCLIAVAILIIPIPKLIAFHSRHYVISLFVYWLVDLVKGILLTLQAYLIGGWIAAYFAAILAVVVSLFLWKNNTFALAAGSIVVLSPILIVVGAIVFLISLLVTKYYFLSTYLAVGAIFIFGLLFVAHLAVWATIVCLGLVVCLDQRTHLRRFRRGMEKKISW